MEFFQPTYCPTIPFAADKLIERGLTGGIGVAEGWMESLPMAREERERHKGDGDPMLILLSGSGLHYILGELSDAKG